MGGDATKYVFSASPPCHLSTLFHNHTTPPPPPHPAHPRACLPACLPPPCPLLHPSRVSLLLKSVFRHQYIPYLHHSSTSVAKCGPNTPQLFPSTPKPRLHPHYAITSTLSPALSLLISSTHNPHNPPVTHSTTFCRETEEVHWLKRHLIEFFHRPIFQKL